MSTAQVGYAEPVGAHVLHYALHFTSCLVYDKEEDSTTHIYEGNMLLTNKLTGKPTDYLTRSLTRLLW